MIFACSLSFNFQGGPLFSNTSLHITPNPIADRRWITRCGEVFRCPRVCGYPVG